MKANPKCRQTAALVGDSLPAFGIVAAVMGVVHALASADRPAAELGALIAHAMVGTFLGILLAYGFISPLASVLRQKSAETTKMMQCVKITLLSNLNGYAPPIAVEFGRKTLYSSERPSFIELEEHVRAVKTQTNRRQLRTHEKSVPSDRHRKNASTRGMGTARMALENRVRRFYDRNDGILSGDVAHLHLQPERVDPDCRVFPNAAGDRRDRWAANL